MTKVEDEFRKVAKAFEGFKMVGDYHTMVYDPKGNYTGQWQPNMLDDDPNDLFLPAEIIDGVPCVNGEPVPPLTAEEMAAAE